MKKNNLLKTVLLFVFAVFLLQGCRSEENALEKSNPSTEYKIIHQNYSLVQKNNNLNQKFTLLENIATANKKKSEKQNSENIIEIDGIKIFKDYVTYVSPIDSSKNTYSFYVENSNYRLAPNSVQNMVFSKKENETDYSSYLVTYTFPEGINSNNKNFNITKIEKLNISSLFSKKSNTANNRLTAKTSSNCPETYSYEIIETKHKCKSGEHSGDSKVGDCNLKGDERPYSTYVIKITTMTADCGTESWGTPESGSSGPGGGSGGASGSTAPSVDTSISLPPTCQTGDCNEEILANKINTSLGLPLDYNKLLWLNSNTEFAEGIWNMLSNDNSEATKNFATWGISFAASNNTSWTQFQNWFLSNQNIIDNLDGYSCAQDLLKQMPVLNNELAKILQDTFGTNDKINIIFKAKEGMGTVDGVRESVDRKNGMFNVTINLNSDMLKYATKEYILVTMYHEALHAYIGYQVTILPYDQYLANFPKVTEYEVKDANGNIIKKYTLDKDHKNFGSFIASLQNSIISYNSSIPSDIALAMAKWGIVTNLTNDEIIKNNNEKDTRNNSNYKGTKCP